MKFRDFSNNTRLTCKADYKQQRIKWDRMKAYWHSNVLPNHRPTVSVQKRDEIQERALDNSPLTLYQTGKHGKSLKVLQLKELIHSGFGGLDYAQEQD